MSALTRIIAEAKRIRKRHPGLAWKTAVKQAGAKYRSGKISGSGSRKKVKKVAKRKKVIRRVKKLHAAEGRAIKSLGSVASHLSAAKKKIESEIGWLEISKFKTSKVSGRKKIQKRINKKKAQYRRIAM